MKDRKYSLGWFVSKYKHIRKQIPGYSMILTDTKGFKPNGQNKKTQKLSDLNDLAEEKGIKPNDVLKEYNKQIRAAAQKSYDNRIKWQKEKSKRA